MDMGCFFSLDPKYFVKSTAKCRPSSEPSVSLIGVTFIDGNLIAVPRADDV